MVHFFAHYLHYESKFLQTLKTVVFRPGRASIDFKEKKRARHVEPMSLYIFVVISFFILSNVLHDVYTMAGVGTYSPEVIAKEEAVYEQQQAEREKRRAIRDTSKTTTLKDFLGAKGYENYKKIQDFADNDEEVIDQKMAPVAPKIFFFMVPVLALLMSIFFAFKKGYTFVEHTVFAIHIHTFWFITQICESVIDIIPIPLLGEINLGIFLIYWTIAQVRFYKARWLYASLVSVMSFGLYLLVFVTIMFAVVILLF